MENISRRRFLKGLILSSFTGMQIFSSSCTRPKAKGYGHLLQDPNKILNLPPNFSYSIISRQGQKMSDGFFTPGYPDGMATFASKSGKTILIRNHEIRPEHTQIGPYGKNNQLLNKLTKDKLYDYGRGKTPCLGGTTTLVFDTKTQQLEKDFLSLAGTIRNCAGGPTPWGSWITCEESVDIADNKLEQDHGYNFEVPARDKISLTSPIPLKEMGRFNHEAVCVDPRTSIVYQTEDRQDGLIYRYIPHKKNKLHLGGKLQALAVRDQLSCDTRNWPETTNTFPTKQKMPVKWINLEDIYSRKDNLRHRGFQDGAAKFARGEGMWFGEKECFFACTSGGVKQQGQIFKYVPSSYEGTVKEQGSPGTLELFAEPNDSNILQACDNLTIAPWGDIIICEDRSTPFIVGITPQGTFYKFAENIGYQSEFAGTTFSHDGSTLFVNIQKPGLTLAITGAWDKKL